MRGRLPDDARRTDAERNFAVENPSVVADVLIGTRNCRKSRNQTIIWLQLPPDRRRRRQAGPSGSLPELKPQHRRPSKSRFGNGVKKFSLSWTRLRRHRFSALVGF